MIDGYQQFITEIARSIKMQDKYSEKNFLVKENKLLSDYYSSLSMYHDCGNLNVGAKKKLIESVINCITEDIEYHFRSNKLSSYFLNTSIEEWISEMRTYDINLISEMNNYLKER
jgi:hypothetical protein